MNNSLHESVSDPDLGNPWLVVPVALAISLLIYRLRPRQNPLETRLWGWAWAAKLSALAILLWLQVSYWQLETDAYLYFKTARELWQHLRYSSAQDGPWPLVWDRRSLNTSWAVLPFFVLSYENFYLLSLFTATISFWAAWRLYRLGRFLLNGPFAGLSAIAFLFLPSTVFWTTPPGKDNLIWATLGIQAWAIHRWLVSRSGEAAHRWRDRVGNWTLAAFCLALQASVRPFWAMAVGCVGVAFSLWWAWAHRRGWVGKLVLWLSVGLLFWAATVAYYRPSNLWIEVSWQRAHLYQMSNKYADPNVYHLYPEPRTLWQAAAAVPHAVAVAFYGPLPGMGTGWLSVLSGLERLLLLSSTVWLLIWQPPGPSWRNRIRARPWIVWLMVFVLPYAVLLAFSAVYWGNLVRYMALIWPFWAACLLGFTLPLSGIRK